ncbi:hypothetical protein EVAR_3569_1 [Eumeta japonica]|uniref:Uncharacterized protein n=1 Tax=Eumeta variegata TaxID=151549 RepID=A0A4C1SVL4_EUMVA|nr:hypothetical protein EVAR_3569_1 [Eumeta japonica]
MAFNGNKIETRQNTGPKQKIKSGVEQVPALAAHQGQRLELEVLHGVPSRLKYDWGLPRRVVTDAMIASIAPAAKHTYRASARPVGAGQGQGQTKLSSRDFDTRATSRGGRMPGAMSTSEFYLSSFKALGYEWLFTDLTNFVMVATAVNKKIVDAVRRLIETERHLTFYEIRVSLEERPIRWVEFRPIKSKRLESQNLSSIGSRTVWTAILFSDIDPGPYHNGRRYLAPVNDYPQRSAPLSS